MGTRCGDIDPAVVVYMTRQTGMSADEMDTALNKKSGMLGISGISSDARDIEKAYHEGNERAILTLQVYVNRVINMIGGYIMQLGHVDAISFTAGLGENDSHLRGLILNAMKENLGLSINEELNSQIHGKEAKISNPDSKVAVFVVPTNEELVIARDTYRILGF